MLRMGKNPNEERTENESDSSYAQRSYSPYQSGESRPAQSAQPSSSPKALTESETIAREIKDGTLSGFVGSGTTVTGESTFKSMLRIDGKFSGRISSGGGTLIVGAGGQVDANVEVAVATIQGIVNGDVVATERIELGRAAKLHGNIQTPSLVIEQGALFEGACKMTQQKSAVAPKVERKSNVIDAPKPDAPRVDVLNKKPDEGPAKKIDVAVAAGH
jgi:cytoskeletal protein CcmA (bactofilin family)